MDQWPDEVRGTLICKQQLRLTRILSQLGYETNFKPWFQNPGERTMVMEHMKLLPAREESTKVTLHFSTAWKEQSQMIWALCLWFTKPDLLTLHMM